MSLSTGEPASETGDDSLSAITFDSDSEMKAKRKSFHRPPPTSPKSPYHSKPRKVASWRSLRTAGSVPLGSRVSLTPQKLWLGSSKQGSLTPALKSDLTLERAWTNSPPSSTPGCLTEAERMQRSNLRRSASHGCVPGTAVYREKEGMYDEIIELKKSLHVQKSNVDLMRTKLRRLEEENSRKDRQIEQLLDLSRGPDFVRTLAERRPDTGWVISGLKQRILKLEQQCKEKSHTIDKLQTDMKTTNLEEMRIAMETCYEEIHRLQTLLASSETTGKKPPVEKHIGLKRQKKMSSALLSLSRSVQELTEENQSLKEDLDRVLSDSPTVSKIKGSVEWSKPRLLRRIAELEKKISLMGSPKSHASEVVRSTPPAHLVSSPSPPAHLVSSPTAHRQPRPGRQESERLRGVVKSLKGERNALRTQLQERDLEVKQLLQTKADLEKELENMKEGREREKALREEIQALTRKFRELEESKKGVEEDPEETSPETQEAPRPPGPSQTDSELDTSEGGSSRPRSGCSERRRDAAARLLQRRWKGHQHRKKKAVLDEAAVLQAAFRAHPARARPLSSGVCSPDPPAVPSPPTQDSPEPRVPSPVVQAEGDPWQEEAITIIQSAFRAHLARARHRAVPDTCGGCPARKAQGVSPEHKLHSPTRPATAGGAGDTPEAPHRDLGPPASHDVSGPGPVGLTRCLRTWARRPRTMSQDLGPSASHDGKEPAPSDSPEPDRLAGSGLRQEDSEGSSGETAEALAPGDGAPRPWGPGAPAAPPPCSAFTFRGCFALGKLADAWELSAEGATQPSPSGLQRAATPPAEDVNSDDSDEIVLAPPLPTKKIASPP
ncbi:PREDICTED: IQ domain-containing protein E [Lipotes vexillifer]|uniref:IQ domain-containing protein E n=1 Tax=Lipotes vexillifer TaxID=118797 RepID=A0A340Y513_LIPVE|nr:PREDICTED: IQ domain-containing protein E [Lipotes vexillifer]